MFQALIYLHLFISMLCVLWKKISFKWMCDLIFFVWIIYRPGVCVCVFFKQIFELDFLLVDLVLVLLSANVEWLGMRRFHQWADSV